MNLKVLIIMFKKINNKTVTYLQINNSNIFLYINYLDISIIVNKKYIKAKQIIDIALFLEMLYKLIIYK